MSNLEKQIRDLSDRIKSLSDHIIASKQKDKDAKRSLAKLVSRRRKFSRLSND